MTYNYGSLWYYSMQESNIWKIIRTNDEEAPSMFIVTCVCVLVFFSLPSHPKPVKRRTNKNENNKNATVVFLFFFIIPCATARFLLHLHIFLIIQYLMASITQLCVRVLVCVMVHQMSTYEHIWAIKLIFNGKRLKWIRNDSLLPWACKF